VYELLIVLGAIAGVAILALRIRGSAGLAWLGWQSVAWIASGLILLAVTQGRDSANLVPVVMGAAALAAITGAMLIESLASSGSWRAEGAIMGLTIPMLVYGFLGLSMYAAQRQNLWLITTLLAIFIVVGMGIIAIMLFNGETTLRGLGAAIGLCLAVYTLGVGYQLTQVRITNPAEPYITTASTADLRLLKQTVEDISTRIHGDPNTLSLQVFDSAPPSLRWALRNQREIRYVTRLNNSAAALTLVSARPEGTQVYVGDAFHISSEAWLGGLGCQLAAPVASSPTQLDCTKLVHWFTQRQVDETSDSRWILWLRQDIALKASGQQ
jgi:hypothetical protein